MDPPSITIHLDFDFNDPILQEILDQEGLNLNLDQDNTSANDTAEEPLKAVPIDDKSKNDFNALNNIKKEEVDDTPNDEAILDQDRLIQNPDQDKTSAKDTTEEPLKALSNYDQNNINTDEKCTKISNTIKNENIDDAVTDEELETVMKEVDEFLAGLESKPNDKKSVMEYINLCKDKAGLTDDDLMEIGVKELNGKLKDTNLEKKEKLVIKQWYITLYSPLNINNSNIFNTFQYYISRRRKIKNRGYATFCRDQREGERKRGLEKISNEAIIVKKYEVGTYM